MSDIFQEVEEGVRQDRWAGFARKYGIWVLGAIVLMLLAVGAWRLYEGWSVGQSRERSEALATAQAQLRDGDAKGALTALELLGKSGPGNFKALTRMEAAQALYMQGDLEGAVAKFDEAAKLASDQDLKDSARLRAAYMAAETQDFSAVQERLQPLIDREGAFSYMARELLGIEAWEAGNLDLARETLEPLTLAFEAPESVRQRAQLALSVIGPAGAPAPGTAPAAPAQQAQSQQAPQPQAQRPQRPAQPAAPPEPQLALPPVRSVPPPSAGEVK